MSLLTDRQAMEINNISKERIETIGHVEMANSFEATLICSVKAIKGVDAIIAKITDNKLQMLPPSQIGSILKIKSNIGFVMATVRSIRNFRQDGSDKEGVDDRYYIMDVEYIGQLKRVDDDISLEESFIFGRGIGDFPVPGAEVFAVNYVEVNTIYFQKKSDSIILGKVSPQAVSPATISVNNALGKHFAILGSTGTGKSSLTALIIRRIVEKMGNAHILILDPHNEYSNGFSDCAEHFDISNLKLPYWLMNFEEHVEMFIGPRLKAERQVEIDILRRAVHYARLEDATDVPKEKITVNTPIPYKLTRLLNFLDQEMGQLNNAETVIPYLRLKTQIDNMRKDSRFDFMFSGIRAQDNLERVIGDLLRFPVNDKPISTIDLSGIPGDIVNVVVSIITRTVFDFAVWSQGANAKPILLICEEAHRYVPASRNLVFSSTKRSIDRIAREGRKYGVSLGLISQRPSDLSEVSLSQCATIFAMRTNNDKDKSFIHNILPEGSDAMVKSLSSLDNGEVLIIGEAVEAPVRVKLDLLDIRQRPTSSNPHFSSHWASDVEEVDFIQDTIKAWRFQGR